MKMVRKILLIMLSTLMMLHLSQARLFADDDPVPSDDQTQEEEIYDVLGDKTAAPYELTDTSEQTRTTTVTLSLPAGEYQNKIDLVFVMDSSTSTKRGDFETVAKDFLDQVTESNPEIELRVAVVKFKGYATDMLEGFVVYNSDNADQIKNAIDTAPSGSGSNLHCGLVMAGDLLEADTEVPDSNKYLIVLTIIILIDSLSVMKKSKKLIVVQELKYE